MYLDPRMNRCGASRYVASLFIVLFLLLLTSCGGGGGGSGNDPASASQGVFLDSPVEGIRFETATQSGITDANGTFNYTAGEAVEFFIGDISLGSALGVSTLTPIDLVSGAVDETNEQVTNILRFLQSLDSDMDASNGIQISSATRTAMMGQTLNFAQTVAGFETDFTPISSAMLGGMVLVSVTDAQAHMRATLVAIEREASGTPFGRITISGAAADIAVIGDVFVPDTVIAGVTWASADYMIQFGIRRYEAQLNAVTFVFYGTGGRQYNLSCGSIVAGDSCSGVVIDLTAQSITFDNVTLDSMSAAPIVINGILYFGGGT